MSNFDIPLHTIARKSRSRAQYAPLGLHDNPNQQQGDGNATEGEGMNTGVLRSTAAVRTTTRNLANARTKGKGKQRERPTIETVVDFVHEEMKRLEE
ncbi:hypothetical protein PAXINDRAFT_103991 [Paxillus involutus ATCC 200175]|uniref:Uncharacterized protein n=1 Tax=Paxillus involutus ATCC 200175 TaxID=664439 RepID=A0A0C9TC63_PAXIN|nr:hypothetical protein PAXINDRAFT_103991 [Paxillus involutus ATCC 200175]